MCTEFIFSYQERRVNSDVELYEWNVNLLFLKSWYMLGGYWYIKIFIEDMSILKNTYCSAFHLKRFDITMSFSTWIILQEFICKRNGIIQNIFSWNSCMCKIVRKILKILLKFGVWNKGLWIIELHILDACDARILLRVVWKFRSL